MKTKFILTAMCLPLAFAACTNEDVLVENQNALENNEVVKFKLSATYGTDGAESRMVNNNGTFLWEGTDVLGAVMNFDGENRNYSNNKFINTLTEPSSVVDFTTQSTTMVGDYLFYYPYSTKMTSEVVGVQYSLVEPQVYDPTGEEMMNNNFMITPNIKVDGNEPGELTLPITLRSIYGYGQLNLKIADNALMGGTTYVNNANIQKIIITYNSLIEKDGIINVDELPLADLSSDHLAELSEAEAPFTNDDILTAAEEEALVGKTEAEIRAAILDKADKMITARVDGDINWKSVTTHKGTSNLIKSVAINCISEENPNGIALAKGGQFSTRVLLPAATSQTVKVDVYTDKGVVNLSTYALEVKPGHKTVLGTSKNNDVLSMATFTPLTEISVISEADFIASMAQFIGTELTELGVKVNGDFVLTPAAVAAIPEDLVLDFKNEIAFEGDMTLKDMKFTTVNLKGGKINLGENITATTVDVEGAEATIVAAGTYTNIDIYSGSLNVAAVDEDGEAVETTVGTVRVSKVDDEGEHVASTLNITNDLKAYVVVFADGVANNAANLKSIQVKKGAVLNNTGVITTKLEVNAGGEVNNAGTIKDGTNGGLITLQTKGLIEKITNNAKIVTVPNSEVTATNGTNAEVVYTVGSRVYATGGHVTYEAEAGKSFDCVKSLNDCVTKILFTGDVSYACTADFSITDAVHKRVDTYEFKGNLTITGEKTLTLRTGSEFIFTGEASVVTSSAQVMNLAKLTVGIDDDPSTTEVDESVKTNVTIVKNTKMGAIKEVFIAEGAQVWNEGTLTSHVDKVTKTGEGVWKVNQLTWKL